MTSNKTVTVVGAGVTGLWQALTLAKRGFDVRLLEASSEPFANSASRYGGTMLAPDCEGEAAPKGVVRWGRQGIELWKEIYPGTKMQGSLVVAGARDRSELKRFAELTDNHTRVDGAGLKRLEPDLGGRFSEALYFPGEAHLVTDEALGFLLRAAVEAGVDVKFSTCWKAGEPGSTGASIVIDCRGLAAAAMLPGLRGVRGERLLVQTDEVTLNRPVRLLHPRHPIYIVPWGEGRFAIGATVIESEDAGGVSVRSALELLAAAYAVDPGFGEAEIIELGAGVRPAFADNTPRIAVFEGGQRLAVNGLFRHGFLLAPVLAEAAADYLESGKRHEFISDQKTSCATALE